MVDVETIGKFYSCDVCGDIKEPLLFRREEQLKKHLNDVHSKEELINEVLDWTNPYEITQKEMIECNYKIVEGEQ